MTKNSVFISTNLNPQSGGGKVSERELEALQKCTNVSLILSNRTDLEYPVPTKSINPLDYRLPDVPFLWDYLAQEYLDQHLHSGNKIDIVFINGNPFGRTVEFFKNWNPEGRVIVDVPAHNLEESIREHKKFGADYDLMYPHNTNEFLMDMQIWHILQADDVIVPSSHSLDALRKLDAIESQKIHTIPHGCDVPDEKELKPFPEQFRVGYAGSMGYDKGVFYLIQAWQELGYQDSVLAYAGHHKIMLDDPGLGPDGIKKGWIYRIPPFKGAGYKLFGWLPSLSEFYPNLSVYVQSSITEGYGLEVLEAMSWGRPVIVSDGVGASDIVLDNNCGLVFEKRDVKKLIDHIRYFKENPSEVIKYGDRARKASLKYQWQDIMKEYEKVIEL